MAIDFEFAELLKSALKTDVTVLAATDHLAEQVSEMVKSYTPVFTEEKGRRKTPPHGGIGDARNAIHVEAHPTEPLARRVISRDFKAIWIEVGTRHMPEYAPFTKTAKYFGGTGPLISSVADAQHGLRSELEKLAKLVATGATASSIKAQHSTVAAARQARSQAFTNARPRRRGRR